MFVKRGIAGYYVEFRSMELPHCWLSLLSLWLCVAQGLVADQQ